MRQLTVVPIVEGHGEVYAVPLLLRRLFEMYRATRRGGRGEGAEGAAGPCGRAGGATGCEAHEVHLLVSPPIRLPRGSLVKAERDFARAVELAARKAGPAGGLLIMVDGDDDCPAELGPMLRERALKQRSDRPIVVVVAKREYEAWFLAAAESLRGHRGVRADACAPRSPESIRGAKERLQSLLEPGERYLETADQAALTAALDLEAAARAPSFARCRSRILVLLETLAAAATGEE